MPEFMMFPKDEVDALALLYMQQQNLSGLAPEEIYDKYKDAHARITAQKNSASEDMSDTY